MVNEDRQELVAKVVAAYKSGLSIAAAGIRCGITKDSARYILENEGVLRRIFDREYDAEKIAEAYRNGGSLRSLAQEHRTSENTIRRLVTSTGTEIRLSPIAKHAIVDLSRPGTLSEAELARLRVVAGKWSG